MEGLISQSLYERLAALRQEMIAGEIGSPAQVFAPVGALIQNRRMEMPRILYVGKATRGFGECNLDGYTGAVTGASKVIDEWLLPGGSAFWQFIRAVLQKLAAKCSQPTGVELLRHFGWSNLAKIGDLDGNPDAWSLKSQLDLCLEALAAEIAAFQPTAVILATTNYAENEVVFPLFGQDDWSFDTIERDRVAYKRHPQFGLVAWTNHPQGMRPPGTRAIVQEFIADLTMRHWRGDPLPQCVLTASIQTGPTSGD
jgi:hypothetical protein